MNQANISQEQVIENLSNKNNWVRLVYMLIYGVALHIAGIIMWLLCTVQFIITMIFGQDNENLRKMAATITEYIHQALHFVSYNSDDKPFPFAKEGPANKDTSAEKPATPDQSEQADSSATQKEEPATIEVKAQAVEDESQEPDTKSGK